MSTEQRIEALNKRMYRFELMLEEQIYMLSCKKIIDIINLCLDKSMNYGDVYVSWKIYSKILPYQNRVNGRVIRNLWLADDSFLIS